MMPTFGMAPTPVPRTYDPAAVSNDKKLWNEFKHGDQLALSKLYERHALRLYRYGLYACKDHELALDCVQELFSRLWSRRQHMTYVDRVQIYLFKSFQRLLIRQLTENRKVLKQSVPGSSQTMPSFEETIIDQESRTGQNAKLRESILSLSKGQREVILLRYFSDLSYPEISEVMEMQVGSVYNLASKAIEKLRKKLSTPALLSAFS